MVRKRNNTKKTKTKTIFKRICFWKLYSMVQWLIQQQTIY